MAPQSTTTNGRLCGAIARGSTARGAPCRFRSLHDQYSRIGRRDAPRGRDALSISAERYSSLARWSASCRHPAPCGGAGGPARADLLLLGQQHPIQPHCKLRRQGPKEDDVGRIERHGSPEIEPSESRSRARRGRTSMRFCAPAGLFRRQDRVEGSAFPRRPLSRNACSAAPSSKPSRGWGRPPRA